MKSRLLTFLIKWRRLYAVIGKTFGFLANECHPETGGVAASYNMRNGVPDAGGQEPHRERLSRGRRRNGGHEDEEGGRKQMLLNTSPPPPPRAIPVNTARVRTRYQRTIMYMYCRLHYTTHYGYTILAGA